MSEAADQYFPGKIVHPAPQSVGSSGGGGQVVTGAFDNPNGNVTPDDPTAAAFYYKDGATIQSYTWSVDDQVWYEFATT